MNKKPETWIGNEIVNRRVDRDDEARDNQRANADDPQHAVPEVSQASRVARRVLKLLNKGNNSHTVEYVAGFAAVTVRSAKVVLRNLQRAGLVEPLDIHGTAWRRKEASRAD